MIFGVSATRDAVVIAQTTGLGEMFVIKSIKSIPFDDLSPGRAPSILKLLVPNPLGLRETGMARLS